MKKNIFYLLCFIVVFVINYLLKGAYDAQQVEEDNQLHLLSIIDNALSPIVLFLLLKFFSTASWKFRTFAVVYGIIMVLELSLGYFYGSGHFDFNYLIGCIVGLVLIFCLDLLTIKNQKKESQEQAA